MTSFRTKESVEVMGLLPDDADPPFGRLSQDLMRSRACQDLQPDVTNDALSPTEKPAEDQDFVCASCGNEFMRQYLKKDLICPEEMQIFIEEVVFNTRTL
ncbi:hypothetical protein BDR05DRAFT_995639 [Suillus weaverae]|nr:hypothetical protein BDR05DRAFT_995639 [Suillus weaverae]